MVWDEFLNPQTKIEGGCGCLPLAQSAQQAAVIIIQCDVMSSLVILSFRLSLMWVTILFSSNEGIWLYNYSF